MIFGNYGKISLFLDVISQFCKEQVTFLCLHFITLNSFPYHLIYIGYKDTLFSLFSKFFSLPWKTPLRSIQNALSFKIKRPCVSSQTHLRFRTNALAFWRSIETKSFIVTFCSIEQSIYQAIQRNRWSFFQFCFRKSLSFLKYSIFLPDNRYEDESKVIPVRVGNNDMQCDFSQRTELERSCWSG